MKIARSLRVSATDVNGNWKTEEASIELEGADIGAAEPTSAQPNDVASARLLTKVLDYECEVFLCKSVKDPAFAEYIKARVEVLSARKVEIDDVKKSLGIR